MYIYIYIQDRWRVGPPPCLHCSFVVGVWVLVLSNCNSSDIGQLPVPIVAFRNLDLSLDTWHLTPGTWHLAPGTWHLAPDT